MKENLLKVKNFFQSEQGQDYCFGLLILVLYFLGGHQDVNFVAAIVVVALFKAIINRERIRNLEKKLQDLDWREKNRGAVDRKILTKLRERNG